MLFGKIIRDLPIERDTSLVLLSTHDENNNNFQEYVAVISHPMGGRVLYDAVEKVDATTRDVIWNKRAIFNGRMATQIINNANAFTLNSKKITLSKNDEKPNFMNG